MPKDLSGRCCVVPAPDLKACCHYSQEDCQYQQALKPLDDSNCIHFLHHCSVPSLLSDKCLHAKDDMVEQLSHPESFKEAERC